MRIVARGPVHAACERNRKGGAVYREPSYRQMEPPPPSEIDRGRAGAPAQRETGMEKRPLEPDSHYEERRIAPKWQRGVLPGAGIYLLRGDYHVAIPGTPAEDRLIGDGALFVAGVRFDAEPMESAPRDEPDVVALYLSERDRLGSGRTVETLGGRPARN